MDNGMIRKYEKAKMYAAEERNRIEVQSMSVKFDGRNNPHEVKFENGAWQCDCDFFKMRGRCSHTMALEIILEEMIPVAEEV
jgi:hypothetical protein